MLKKKKYDLDHKAYKPMEMMDMYFCNQPVCFIGIVGILFQEETHPGTI